MSFHYTREKKKMLVDLQRSVDCSHFKGLGDLVITPVIPKTPNSLLVPSANGKPKTEVVSFWSRVGHPTLEDYVLMKEDTFTVDSSCIDSHNR